MLTLSMFPAIDGTPQVPMMSMICMATTLLLAVIPAIFVIRYAKKKLQGSLVSLVFGFVFYAVFEFILLSLVVSAWQNIKAVSSNTLLMSILESLVTALTGIIGRFILVMAIAKSKLIDNGNSIGNAIMGGVGYTLYRSVLILIIIGQRFIMALTINMYGIGNLSSDVEETEIEGLAQIYESFLTTPAYSFLIDGIKYLMVLVISVSLAIIIYAVYNKRAHSSLIGFSLLINFLFELPYWLNHYKVSFGNTFVMLLVMALFAAWMALLALKTWNVSLREEVKAKEAELKAEKHQAFPDFNANIKK